MTQSVTEQARGATVSYRTADSDSSNLPLPDIRKTDVSTWLPVREPKSYRGSFAKPGKLYMSTLDAHVTFESRLEAWVLLLADFHGGLKQVIPQPCRVHFARTTKPRSHVPDFLFIYEGGRIELVDVKGAVADSPAG